MNIENSIFSATKEALKQLYNFEPTDNQIQLQNTRKDFVGDITLVVFPFLRFSKKTPEKTGEEIGLFLKEKIEEVESFNVIKGFLNLVISDSYWINLLKEVYVKRILD